MTTGRINQVTGRFMAFGPVAPNTAAAAAKAAAAVWGNREAKQRIRRATQTVARTSEPPRSGAALGATRAARHSGACLTMKLDAQ